MKIPKQFIKPFPSYEEVFYDNLEQHKKHFLPICSINLQCINPKWDEWLHIVSAKEIHEGCVGDFTQPFHTSFTKEDTLGFDVIWDDVNPLSWTKKSNLGGFYYERNKISIMKKYYDNNYTLPSVRECMEKHIWLSKSIRVEW